MQLGDDHCVCLSPCLSGYINFIPVGTKPFKQRGSRNKQKSGPFLPLVILLLSVQKFSRHCN